MKNGKKTILLPEATGWMSCHDSQFLPVSDPAKNKSSVFVWPTQWLVGIPLWLQTTDPAIYPGMAALQLEKRGIQDKLCHLETLQVRPLVVEGERTLVLALAASRQMGDIPLVASEYSTIFDLYEWQENSLVLFRELGEWVAVFVRGKHPVYYLKIQISQNLQNDLFCLRKALQAERIISPIDKIVLWDELPHEVTQQISAILQVQVSSQKRPLIQTDRKFPEMLHPQVVEYRKNKQQRRLWILGAVSLLMLTLLYVGYLLAQIYFLQQEVTSLEKELKGRAPELSVIRQAFAKWKLLESSINPDDFPLEILFRSSASLPPDGVRLVDFEQKEGVIRLAGEASSSTLAFQYFEKVKADETLKNIHWDMGQPDIMPNNSVQFVIRGEGANVRK